MKRKKKQRPESLRHGLLRECFKARLNIEPEDDEEFVFCCFNGDFGDHIITLMLFDEYHGAFVDIEVRFEKRKPQWYHFKVRTMKELEKIISIWKKYAQ